jgi:FixJ family two-component response regulator
MNETHFVAHLVDDDASFLTATSRLLRASGFLVKTFASAREFLAQLPADAMGCVIADLQMPNMSGLDLQAALVRSGRVLPVIFLTGQGDIPSSVHAMRNGAEDFLEKRAPKEKILAAVRRALARAASEIETMKRRNDLRARFDGLSPRELEVLGQVVQGKLNKQIGADLGICERTVKAHRTAITTKLRAPSVAELTRLVQECGLFEKEALTCPKGQ